MLTGASGLHAWTAPPSNPPLNNVAAPVNVGGTTQVKAGILGSTGFFSLGKMYISGGTTGPYDESDITTLLTNLSTGWPSDVLDLTLFNNGSIGAEAYCNDFGLHCVAVDDLTQLPIIADYRRYAFDATEYDFVINHPAHSIAEISVNLHSTRIQADTGGLVRAKIFVDDILCAADQDARDSEGPVIKDFFTSASCAKLLDSSPSSKIGVRIQAEPETGWIHYPVLDVTIMNNPNYTP